MRACLQNINGARVEQKSLVEVASLELLVCQLLDFVYLGKTLIPGNLGLGLGFGVKVRVS